MSILCKESRYVAFGIVNDEGKPTKLCYAVTAKGVSKPKDNDLVLISTPAQDFWVLSQSSENGNIVR